MTRQKNLFFHLLRCGLWDTPVGELPEPYPSQEEWKGVWDDAKRQTVRGLMWSAITQLPREQRPPQPIMWTMLAAVDAIERSNEQMVEAVRASRSLLMQEGVEPILMKGLAVALLYHHPEWRECGDIDWYVPSGNTFQVLPTQLRKKGFDLMSSADGSLSFDMQDVDVELHQQLIDIEAPQRRKILSQLIGEEGFRQIRIEDVNVNDNENENDNENDNDNDNENENENAALRKPINENENHVTQIPQIHLTKTKAAGKREENDACISYPEREQARPKVKTLCYENEKHLTKTQVAGEREENDTCISYLDPEQARPTGQNDNSWGSEGRSGAKLNENRNIKGGMFFSTPSPLLSLVMLNAHLMKHAFTVGVGLRQFCDMARAYHTWHGQYDTERLIDYYNRLGLRRWTDLLHSILVIYLGLPLQELPGPLKKREADARRLMGAVMKGGNFGQHTKAWQSASDSHANIKRHTVQQIIRKMPLSMRYAPWEMMCKIGNLAIGQWRKG